MKLQMVSFCGAKAVWQTLTLTLLRHSYLNSRDWNKLTIVARRILHRTFIIAQKLRTPTNGTLSRAVMVREAAIRNWLSVG